MPNIVKKALTLSVFDRILQSGVRQGYKDHSRKSIQWYRDRAKGYYRGVSGNKLLKRDTIHKQEPVNSIEIGKMYMYVYDAKHKATLPYYDRFPLIFPIAYHSDGVLGINFHYLPLNYRAKLMDALYSLASDKRMDAKTRMIISYKILNSASKFKYFRPTVHKYLYTQFRSNLIAIEPNEWNIALFLPVANFRNAPQYKVWQDSVKKINS